MVETHFDEYLDTLQSKLNAASKDKRNLERLLQRAQQQPEGTAKKGASDPATLEKRIATADKKIAALEKTIGEVNGIIASDGPVIPVEAGVYFWHPNEVVWPVQRRGRSFHGLLPVFPNPLRGDA